MLPALHLALRPLLPAHRFLPLCPVPVSINSIAVCVATGPYRIVASILALPGKSFRKFYLPSFD